VSAPEWAIPKPGRPAGEQVALDALEAALRSLNAAECRLERYRAALVAIRDADYRGNRYPSAVIAARALEAGS